MKISSVNAYRIWDSRGRPTIEVEVRLRNGGFGRGITPAGASRGSHEAVELRDGGALDGGLGVGLAIAQVESLIAPALIGQDASDQAAIDQTMITLDGTVNKSRLGGNAMIATSMAVLSACANALRIPLWQHLAQGKSVRMPLPEIQIFGGGAHADRRVDIQDFMVMPVGAHSFDEALRVCADIYRAAGALMTQRGSRMGVADEGGWWPDFRTNQEALDTLALAIHNAGYDDGTALISLDFAASEFGKNGRYRLGLESRDLSGAQWIEQICDWVARYPIISIEDPVSEDDQVGMRAITEKLGHKVQIIGDDFLVTNAHRVAAAQAAGCCNAVLIKPNQAGTISETRAALEAGRAARWGTIVSARSGETEDVIIAHLAVGWNAGQLKVGSFARSERMAKWNEALRIEREHPQIQGFAGRAALPVLMST
jgi:enolase